MIAVLVLMACLCGYIHAFSSVRNAAVPVRQKGLLHMNAALSTPPTTFLACVEQAAKATRRCLDQGTDTLMEVLSREIYIHKHTRTLHHPASLIAYITQVEFPPLPLEFLEDSASSARDIADANTRWALEFAKSFTDM